MARKLQLESTLKVQLCLAGKLQLGAACRLRLAAPVACLLQACWGATLRLQLAVSRQAKQHMRLPEMLAGRAVTPGRGRYEQQLGRPSRLLRSILMLHEAVLSTQQVLGLQITLAPPGAISRRTDRAPQPATTLCSPTLSAWTSRGPLTTLT